ncbi:MAG: hypothetical protein ACRDGB_11520, partial [Candidatus Limnocylindria bacterium]
MTQNVSDLGTTQVRSLAEGLEDAVSDAMAQVLPTELASQDPLVRRSDHADFQSNVALAVAKQAGRSPRELAGMLAEQLRGLSWLSS